MEKVLYDGPFKIVEVRKMGSLTLGKILYEGEEVTIRFKLNNLEKIIEYVRSRFWNRSRLKNPETGVPEERPLKQHLKYNYKLFYR